MNFIEKIKIWDRNASPFSGTKSGQESHKKALVNVITI